MPTKFVEFSKNILLYVVVYCIFVYINACVVSEIEWISKIHLENFTARNEIPHKQLRKNCSIKNTHLNALKIF